MKDNPQKMIAHKAGQEKVKLLPFFDRLYFFLFITIKGLHGKYYYLT